MMKVLLFSTQWPEYMVELANALDKRKLNVVLLMPRNHRFTQRHSELLSQTVKLVHFTLVTFKSIRKNFGMLIEILKVIRRERPDILHIQANGHRLFYWIFFLMPRHIKIINTVHDPIKHEGDALSLAITDDTVRFWCRYFVKRYIVHGERLRVALSDSYKIPISRIDVIQHGHFGIYRKFQTEHVGLNAKQVLFFGRIWRYKGLRFFIDAANKVAELNPDITFVIAGRGEDFSEYQQMIRFPKNFRIYNDRVSLDKAAQLFEESAVVVLPYIEATQSGVIPVAFAFGKPVIASKVGSIPEVVEHDYNGLLIEPANSDVLAASINLLVNDAEYCRRLGANALATAQSQLSWERIAELTEQCYQRK